MLVLSRRKDQQIIINGNIILTIVRFQGDKVFIGIDAPKDIPVIRPDAINQSPRTQDQD